jgi:hypothetical protein
MKKNKILIIGVLALGGYLLWDNYKKKNPTTKKNACGCNSCGKMSASGGNFPAEVKIPMEVHLPAFNPDIPSFGRPINLEKNWTGNGSAINGGYPNPVNTRPMERVVLTGQVSMPFVNVNSFN